MHMSWHVLGSQHVSDYNILQARINSVACSETGIYTFFSVSHKFLIRIIQKTQDRSDVRYTVNS